MNVLLNDDDDIESILSLKPEKLSSPYIDSLLDDYWIKLNLIKTFFYFFKRMDHCFVIFCAFASEWISSLAFNSIKIGLGALMKLDGIKQQFCI